MTSHARIAYLTDAEGRWDKLASFCEGSDEVQLRGDGTLELADEVSLVFGGDVCDRGPDARRLIETFLDAQRRYGDRVVLLAGNRDLNKLRLRRELAGHPPPSTPSGLRDGPRAALLHWILSHTMGAREAFEHRRRELFSAEGGAAEEPATMDDERVAESFLDDVAPGGPMLRYLRACRLAHRAGTTLFVHGGVTSESLGVVPGRERLTSVDAWIAALNELLVDELDRFDRGASPDTILAYQAPQPGTIWNQASIVYGRLADEDANPVLPDDAVIATLAEHGVSRVVVGHTPSGDCPAIVRAPSVRGSRLHASSVRGPSVGRGAFELVLADNSYGRVEHGARVCVDDRETRVTGRTVLDDGSEARVSTRLALEDESPIGLRDEASGRLVKARLEGGEFLTFLGLPGRRVAQTRVSEDELARWRLVPPRPRPRG
ncbi:MAG: metallophosphoesterase [Sandaracinus sp.]